MDRIVSKAVDFAKRRSIGCWGESRRYWQGFEDDLKRCRQHLAAVIVASTALRLLEAFPSADRACFGAVTLGSDGLAAPDKDA